MVIAILVLATTLGAGPQRTDASLTFGWEISTQRPISLTPPVDGWERVQAPHIEYMDSTGPGSALWFRRTIKATQASKTRSFLDFRAALYSPKVWIDGTLADEWVGGWGPHQVEITRWVADGRSHQLLVRCQDRSATFADGFHLPTGAPESALAGKTIMPVGGYKETTGLWLPVVLRQRPTAFLVDSSLKIETSVRKHQLDVSGAVNGVRQGQVAVVTTDASGVKTLVGTAPIDAKGQWHIQKIVANPKLWSPESPHLYGMTTTLLSTQHKPLDVSQTRFGFREMWTKGPDFYLNGVKRHLLASSSWPVQEWMPPAEVRRRVRDLKNIGAMAFRLHIGLWQEDFLDAADEAGVLIIPEMPVYTDGSGFYAYKDPRFWANYRSVVADLIKRDRNHASVVMWSLGNEILFMGNAARDPDLPKKLGALARFAKTVDSTRPYTYEADLDPDGAYDVIGLHYPHELPFQSAYPVICDWLDQGKLTEAAGGMLGQTSNQFHWDRKKPLYIGEYLWVPMGDYSAGTVFFGDEAYRNRELFLEQARSASWIDQTIAYRRAGVSGLSPWTATDFGMAKIGENPRRAQAFAYKKVAAYIQNRNLRAFSGQTFPVHFDVFNDSAIHRNLKLRLTLKGKTVIKKVPLDPAGYAKVDFNLTVPDVSKPTALDFHYALCEGAQVHDQVSDSLKVTPRVPLTAPEGWTLVTDRLTPPAGDVEKTVWVIPEHAMDPKIPSEAKGLPLVGGSSFDTEGLRTFIEKGGRAVILAQNDLSGLGQPIRLVDHLSTLQFPSSDFTVRSDDLSYWGQSIVVASRQIERTGIGGMRSLTVTGGVNSLAQSPIAYRALGRGVVVFVQALAGSKQNEDPAAADVVQKAIDWARSCESALQKPICVVGNDKTTRSLLQELKLNSAPVSPANSGGLIMIGDEANAESINAASKAGVPILWIKPTVAKFNELKAALGVPGLSAISAKNTASLYTVSPLIQGVTREEIDLCTAPSGWDRSMSPITETCRTAIVPAGPSRPVMTIDGKAFTSKWGFKTPTGYRLKRKDVLGADFRVPKPGWYEVVPDIRQLTGLNAKPRVELQIDLERRDWVSLGTLSRVKLLAGTHHLALSFYDLGQYGDPRLVELHNVTINACPDYPEGVEVLASPGSIVDWRLGKSIVVVDTIEGHDRPDNRVKATRFLGALLGNLGMPFLVDTAKPEYPVGTGGFKVESGLYNSASDSSLELRTNGSAVAKFFVLAGQGFDLIAEASSTGVGGVYSEFKVEIDGVEWGTAQCSVPERKAYRIGHGQLATGPHEIRVRFTNDASNATEDRNLWIHRISLQPTRA